MKYSRKKKTLIKEGYTLKWKQVGCFCCMQSRVFVKCSNFEHSFSELYFQGNYQSACKLCYVCRKNIKKAQSVMGNVFHTPRTYCSYCFQILDWNFLQTLCVHEISYNFVIKNIKQAYMIHLWWFQSQECTKEQTKIITYV